MGEARDFGSEQRSCRRTAAVGAAVASVAAAIAAAVWWRRNPSVCPYALRISVQVPHPFITRSRLRHALAPSADERLLEVGPGTGYYTLSVAEWIGREGRLDIFDQQQAMLDHTMRRTTEAGLANVVPTQGDASCLPYENDTFDGAFLVTVLGEIPDQVSALSELRRVLRPGGRLVVGEIFGVDPHWVSAKKLRALAGAAGLDFERIDNYMLGSYVVLRRPHN